MQASKASLSIRGPHPKQGFGTGQTQVARRSYDTVDGQNPAPPSKWLAPVWRTIQKGCLMVHPSQLVRSRFCPPPYVMLKVRHVSRSRVRGLLVAESCKRAAAVIRLFSQLPKGPGNRFTLWGLDHGPKHDDQKVHRSVEHLGSHSQSESLRLPRAQRAWEREDISEQVLWARPSSSARPPVSVHLRWQGQAGEKDRQTG